MDYAIIINGIECEFDGTISMVKNNPIFSDEISYSLQFSFSADSEINRQAHEFIDLPSVTSSGEKEFSCIIRTDSMELVGTVISKYQNGSFVDYFKDSGAFFSQIKEKTLSDIPFNKFTFGNLTYNDLDALFNQYHLMNLEQPFSFPRVIYGKPGDKLPVKIDFKYKANEIPENLGYSHVPVIPFIHLHYIVSSLFDKFGISVQDSVFNHYQTLRQLCFASNFMLNEFEIDRMVASEKTVQIARIEASKDPEVTTVTPHALPQHALIYIRNTVPSINTRILQIEIKDEFTFKLLGEDTSSLSECILLYTVTSVDIEEIDNKSTYILTLDNDIIQIDQFVNNWAFFNVTSNYPNGIQLLSRVYDEENVLQRNKMRFWGTESGEDRSADFEGAKLYFLAKKNLPYGQAEPNPSTNVGVLQTLNPIISRIKYLNPADHVPGMKITDFIFDLEKLGLYTFIDSNKAESHLIKDILNSPKSVDVSEYAETIRDVENTAKSGYNLKVAVDSSDDFAKKMQPVTSIDPKYKVKDPVNTKADLSYAGSETDDVRLVTDENAYYVFNKSFLNAENNWKFLCYNLLDKKEGDGGFEVEPKFSPVICDRELFPYPGEYALSFARLDIPCNCPTFFDKSLKSNPRLLLFHLISDPDSIFPFVSSDIYNYFGVNSFNGKLAIRWSGEKSIYEELLKEYIEWQVNIRKDCVTMVHWPMELFANFRFQQKYRIRGVDYLVKSIKYNIDFKNKRIYFNETELAKV